MTQASTTILTATALALCACLTACQSSGRTDPLAITQGTTYPASPPARPTPQARQLAIQVLRDETHITATNTTSEDLAGRLWLNKWFSIEVSQWAPGQTLTIDLRDVRDQYGGSMRAGGFWATKEPEKLVLAQLQPVGSNDLIGLIVAE